MCKWLSFFSQTQSELYLKEFWGEILSLSCHYYCPASKTHPSPVNHRHCLLYNKCPLSVWASEMMNVIQCRKALSGLALSYFLSCFLQSSKASFMCMSDRVEHTPPFSRHTRLGTEADCVYTYSETHTPGDTHTHTHLVVMTAGA